MLVTNDGFYFYFHPSATFMLVWLILIGIQIIGLWRIFEKAGQPGWAATIPFYNIIILLQIIGRPWWYLLFIIIVFIPFVKLVLIIWGVILINNLLSKSFGQNVVFTLGLIFLSPIFLLILGFGNYTYEGPGGAPVTFGATDYEKPFDINA